MLYELIMIVLLSGGSPDELKLQTFGPYTEKAICEEARDVLLSMGEELRQGSEGVSVTVTAKCFPIEQDSSFLRWLEDLRRDYQSGN